MPAYHSSFNDVECPSLCGMAVLPIRTSIKGPCRSDPSAKEDIIDEALKFFRANVLFASFDVKGSADRVIIFLTLYITQCLQRLEKARNKESGKKVMFELAREQFPLPGEPGWLLGGHIPAPGSRKEAEEARNFLKQIREECGLRLVERVFDSRGKPNKFWIAFSKRKFMNIHIR